jgi:hypothetical protein
MATKNYIARNNYDGNNVFEITADSVESAAVEVLGRLGWSLSEPSNNNFVNSVEKENRELREKVEMYENFLHRINSFVVLADNEGVKELVMNADRWSYAHRVGNGELSDEEQEQLIKSAFLKLCDTPEADAKISARQKAYMASKTQTNQN